MRYAAASAMSNGVKRYQDLIVWQIGDALRREVYRLLETGSASADWRFRDQLRDAVASVPANIAEGYRRLARKTSLDSCKWPTPALEKRRTGWTTALRVGIGQKPIWQRHAGYSGASTRLCAA